MVERTRGRSSILFPFLLKWDEMTAVGWRWEFPFPRSVRLWSYLCRLGPG